MLELLKKKFQMDDIQWATVSSYFKKMEVPAGTTLLREGEVAKRIFFIDEGCVRTWFIKDGRDMTFQFFFENETVVSIESFQKEVPSIVSIETIEACRLWYIDKPDVDKLVTEDEAREVRNGFTDILFERMFLYKKLFFSIVRDTPLQRYDNLTKEKPEIIQRVPEHYIASFLGVGILHLHRIKRQLSWEKRKANS